jgi:AcrR family transcriptional regulator
VNTKGVDRRVRRTRQLLQEALLALILEKGYDAITVQDVIDRADVGRSTFYAHFQDKEDLFLSEFEMLRSMFEQHMVAASPGTQDPWELTLVMFRHAQDQHRLYKALAGKQAGSIALTHIQRYLAALLREHLRPAMSRKTKAPVPPDVVAHYLVSSFMGLLTWWLDQNLPYPAEEINEMYRKLTQPGVDSLL